MQHCVVPTVENCDSAHAACGVEGCWGGPVRYSHVIAADVAAVDVIGGLFGWSAHVQPLQVRAGDWSSLLRDLCFVVDGLGIGVYITIFSPRP